MGFMGLSVIGSDMAADSASKVVDAVAKQLAIEFKEEGNEYNTPGPLNVAMIIVEMCDHTMYHTNDNMQALAKECYEWLKKHPKYGDPTKDIKQGIEDFINDGKF